MDIVTLFYDLDKFAVGFSSESNRPLLEDGKVHRDRPGQMCLSEIMTIQVLFHCSTYRTFKHFYLKHVCVHLRSEFPNLLSYNRFVEQIPRTFVAMTLFPADSPGVMQRHQFHRLYTVAGLS